jgi:melanoma-associated antigen p97
VGHAAGWIIPLAWLITNERIRDYGCNAERAAAEYFSKACAPGAQSSHFQMREQENYWEYSHLCDLCHGTAGSYCHRNHMEDYYGHTGAFRCLVEGGGNVAFVKHTTVAENCDGRRKEWWARNQLTTDYELLCRDGTRAPAREYKRCYLGEVKANAIVTSPTIGYEKLNAIINLLKYAQQFYGQKVPDEFSFSMYYSEPPYADLIFQDATQQLIVLPEEEWHYTKYLDKEFLKAYAVVECRSGASYLLSNPITVTLTISFTLFLSFVSKVFHSSKL